mmetsp:Transcript_19821/g.30627  ORF Transcript_19821/g.30627 Transcript_19821/m.30627 type:complete len:604 (-) Transcript_19821:156-1967(-)|eukprot:CAMPEP_0195289126 /NCGR_PEP_ID=MMETSP0707-20130614/5529_1 /TAXON_ID=33640 /ORGANISM="Asterionellopsis glacialis, Strain CCMP134" /LENGTH=603 /DNA_ID=CAMNT_0040349095 /DNA_START=147 /DNA_END=1958 /DNA_ORIENTATION=+
MPPQQISRKVIKGQDEDSFLAMQALLKFRTETPPVEKKNKSSAIPELAQRSQPNNHKPANMKPKSFVQQKQQPQYYYGGAPSQVRASPMRSPRPLPSPYSRPVQQYAGVQNGATNASASAAPYHSNPAPNPALRRFPENVHASNGITNTNARTTTDAQISVDGIRGFVPNSASPSMSSLQSNGSPQLSAMLPPHQMNDPSNISTPERKQKRAGKKSTPAQLPFSEPNDPNEKPDHVRKSEIEAALRSRPQRGRKRENLSNEERLELTRTRNREHAKSTRMRKKARYQELLDNEERFKELQKTRDLIHGRTQCVLDFLIVRTQMLHGKLSGDDTTKAELNQRSTQNEPRSVSFSDGLLHLGEESADTDTKSTGQEESIKKDDGKPSCNSSLDSSVTVNKKVPISLGDVVKDITTFVYTYEPQEANNVSRNEDVTRASMGIPSLKCVSDMKQFDDDLVRSMLTNDRSGLSFRAKNSTDGIAINGNGVGFVEVEVTLRPSNGGISEGQEEVIVVQTAILKVQFAEDSSKLCSVSWHVVKDRSMTLPNQHDGKSSPARSSDESSDSLVCQTSFPSVVSLEQSHSSGAAGENSAEKNHPEGNGPGMNI